MRLKLEYIIVNKGVKVSTQLSAEKISDICIDHIMYDSRMQNVGEETLFLGLGGDLKHIEQAREKGVRLFMVSEKPKDSHPDEVYFVCQKVLESFQQIAKRYREKHSGTFIGITGSNGKTVTKEWMYELLSNSYACGKSPASYNSQLGVPIAVLGIEEDREFAIIEAGISRKGEMNSLQKMVKPDIGVLTTMGDAHSEGFESFEEKVAEKIQLFRGGKKVIYERTDQVNDGTFSSLEEVELISWSFKSDDANYSINLEEGEQLTIQIKGKNSGNFIFPLRDHASISNIIHGIILALELSISLEKIQEQLFKIRPVSMRLELMKAPLDCLLINDSYNADLTSLQNALEFALMQKNKRDLTLIMSEFNDQKNMQGFLEKLKILIKSYPIENFYFVGNKDVELPYDLFFPNTAELLNHLIKNKPQSELILIKGARRYKLETVASFLQENPHRTILQTQLSSIAHNIKHFQSLGKGEHKVMAVVKAGAYGSDSVRISKFLENFGVDYLAVAYVEEGIELRNEGITKPIMVMNPDPLLFSLAAEYDLEPEIFSMNQLRKIDFTKEIKIHINIDSGMNRLGFKEEQLEEVIDFIKSSQSIKVESIFSHLSSSDEKEKVDVSRAQDAYFSSCYNRLAEGLAYRPIKHICNSYGAINFPEMHYDMIRIGIGMHGFIDDVSLECSHRLISFVAQVKEVKKGESVGYNQGYVAKRDMKTATVSIGYADGISRKHGNGESSYYLNGLACKTVGKIAMDTSIIDITETDVKEGDEVVIFENKKQLFALCKVGELIPYELICGIGKRVARNSNIQ